MFEDYVSQAALQQELARAPGLAGVGFDPVNWPGEKWPTLQQMIDSNHRLLMLSENSSAGSYMVNGSKVQVMKQETMVAENYWSLGTTIGQHDYSCPSRFRTPLNRSTVSLAGKSWRPLLAINHFHGVGETSHSRLDNRYDRLQDRFDNYCGPASGRERPNFLSVDFFHQGDTLEFAGVKTHGGLVMYEGRHVTQDVVCGIAAAPSRHLKFATEGCENDEAKSGRLENVKAGTVFKIFDSPSGSKSDDYAILTVKRNISKADVPTFEKNVNNADYRLEFYRKNGLDGKVSRVEVTAP